MRSSPTVYTALGAGLLFTACREAPITTLGTPSYSAMGNSSVQVVNVSSDTTAQNETPLAVNPANPLNLITGNNDWNYNDGCGVNATFDGGKTWTPTLPNGFVPGITAFTNDPSIPGTGAYDFGGDPAVAFSARLERPIPRPRVHHGGKRWHDLRAVGPLHGIQRPLADLHRRLTRWGQQLRASGEGIERFGPQ